jgi:hypothetical protein
VNGLGNGRYNTLKAVKSVNPHGRKGTENNTAKLEGLPQTPLYPLADAESTELIQKIKTDRTEQVTHSGLAV